MTEGLGHVAARVPVLLLVMSGLAQTPGKGLVLVLIGPPGSGKTTQAEFLTKKYHLPVLTADSGMSNEQFDVRLKVLNSGKGFIIDGYPATHAQAQHLAVVVKQLNLPSPIIINSMCRMTLCGSGWPEKRNPRLWRSVCPATTRRWI